MKSLARTALAVSGFFAMGMNAQEFIPLSEDEIAAFGIEFSTVQPMDGDTGMEVPATVINSPLASSAITARYGGVLEGWEVMPGDTVEAGQILGVIDSREVLGIQQEWIMADSVRMEAEFNLDKDLMLFAEGVISEQRLMQTRRDYQQARINAMAASQALQLAGFTPEQMAALLESSDGLGLYYVRAPMPGDISHLAMNAGAYVAANTELVNFSSGNLWLRAQLPARLGRQLEPGQRMTLAGSSQVLTLRQQDFAADENSQMIDIYAEFDSAVSLLPGQVVSLRLAPAGGGLLIPDAAVVHSGDLAQVFVRTDGGVEARSLSLIPVGNAYLTQSGISAGDQVVIRGTAQLKGIQLGLGGE